MGATIPQQFGAGFIYNEFGIVTGTVSCTQFPTGTCKILRFKADPDNIGQFALGNEFGCLFPMSPGDDTGWLSAINVNQFYYSNPSGTSDYLYWWLQD